MQCVLNRLLYVIFDKLPHINANFDFLPEPGGMENISIKQIMLEEQTSRLVCCIGKEDVFVQVWCIFSGWPFHTQNERDISKNNMRWAVVLGEKEDSGKYTWGGIFHSQRNRIKCFLLFCMVIC